MESWYDYLGGGVTELQGVVIEALITLVLVQVAFATAADTNNTRTMRSSASLALGMSITFTTCHPLPWLQHQTYQESGPNGHW